MNSRKKLEADVTCGNTFSGDHKLAYFVHDVGERNKCDAIYELMVSGVADFTLPGLEMTARDAIWVEDAPAYHKARRKKKERKRRLYRVNRATN
jgi:hypothetical protein